MDATTILNTPPSERLTLQALAKEQNVAPPTTWRWALRGVNQLRLPSAKIGSRRMTSRAAFVWWCTQLTHMADGVPMSPVSQRPFDLLEEADRKADRLLENAPGGQSTSENRS
jgi:hypothetical protein